jgi:hypothetical protein
MNSYCRFILPVLLFTLHFLNNSAQAQTTWTGALSTAWNLAGNWTPATIPVAATNVIIPSRPNQPTIANGVSAVGTNITIQSGAVLTIVSGGRLDFSGNAAIDGSIIGAGNVYMIGTGAQNIQGVFCNLGNNNSSSASITATGNVTVNGDYRNNSTNCKLNMAAFQLAATTVTNNGTILTSCTINPALSGPASPSWGNVQYTNTTGGQTVAAGTYNRLYMNTNTDAINTAGGDITLNEFMTGVGILDVGDYRLIAGSSYIAPGKIRTRNTSLTPIPAGSSAVTMAEYYNPAGGQTIVANRYTSLKLSNTSGTQTASGDIIVGTLITNQGSRFEMNAFAMDGVGARNYTGHSGLLRTSCLASPAIPGTASGWGGTVEYYAPTGGQSLNTVYKNLILSNASGTQTTNNLTISISDTLYIVSPQCTLDLGSFGTLNLGNPNINTVINNGIIKTSANNDPIIMPNPTIPVGQNWGTSGTVMYDGSNGVQAIHPGRYYNLIVSNALYRDTIYADITVNGTFTKIEGAELDLGSFRLIGSTGTTIANSGLIKTQNTSSSPLPEGKTWGGTVIYNATSGAQTIMGGRYQTLTLTHSNGTDTASGDITVDTAMSIPANVTMDMKSKKLSGAAATFTNSGLLRTAYTLGTPLPSGKTWGNTVEYYATAGAQTVMAGRYNRLTLMHTTGTDTATGDITIDTAMIIPANVTMDMKTGRLSGASATYTHNGILKTANTSGSPIPSGRTWVGMVEYNSGAGAQTIMTGTYRRLAITHNSGTDTVSGDITVDTSMSISANATVDMKANRLIAAGDSTLFACNGTLITSSTYSPIPIPLKRTWGGTVIYNRTAGGQRVVHGTYNNLTLNNTAGTQTTTGDLVVNGTLITLNGGTLDMDFFGLTGTINPMSNGLITTHCVATPAITNDLTWGGSVEYRSIAGGQNVSRGIYNNLRMLNSSGSNGTTGNIAVNGTLATTAGGILNMASNTLTGTLTTIDNKGTIRTSNTSSAPFASGKTWGGTVEYYATSGGQTVMAGTYNRLTLTNTSGTDTASGNITVDTAMSIPANVIMDMKSRMLSGASAIYTNNGTLRTANNSTTPIPSGKTWGGTVQYNATSGGQTIVTGTYATLTLTHTSGTDTASGNITVNTDMSIPVNATLDMKANLLSGAAATYTNSGTLKTTNTSAEPIPSNKTWGGTVEYNALSGSQNITGAVSYNNLTLINTTGTNTAAANLVVNGTLNIPNTSALLQMGTFTLTGSLTTITNNGTITTNNTSATPLAPGKTWGGTGMVAYALTSGNQNVVQGTYNHLLLSNTSNTNTATGDITLANTGALTTQNGGTFDLAAFRLLAGTSTAIAHSGTIKTQHISTNAPLPLGKIWTGIVDHNASTASQTIVTGTYGTLNLTHSSGGIDTVSGDVTVTNSMIIPSGVTLDMKSSRLIGASAAYTNNGTLKTANTSALPVPAGKTWTGVVEYNAASANQTVMAGTYNTLTLTHASGADSASGAITVNTAMSISANTIMDMKTNQLSGSSAVYDNNGTLKTANTSAAPIPLGKTWDGNVDYNNATGGQRINANSFNNLVVSNSSGTQLATSAIVVDGTFNTFAGGTLNMASNTLSGNLTTITNNGIISTSNISASPLSWGKIWGGTGRVQYAVVSGGQTIVSGTYYDLLLTNTGGINIASENIVIKGTLTTHTGGTFDLANFLLIDSSGTMACNGIIKTRNVTATPLPQNENWIGTVEYYATAGAQTVAKGTYNNLLLSNTSGTNSTSGDITVNGALTIPVSTIFDLTSYTLGGSLTTVSNSGSIKTRHTASANPLPSNKTWGGSVEYNAAAGAQTIANGTYTNLLLSNTSGTNTANGNLTINTTLTTTAGGTLDLSTNTLAGAAAAYTNNGIIKTAHTVSANPIPSNKTWGGTVQYNATSGGQTIVTGTYATLTLTHASGTDTASGNITVNTAMSIPVNTTLDMKANLLSGAAATYTNSGTLKTANTAAGPIPSNKTWGGTVEYNALSGNQNISGAVSYNNLTLSNNSGTNTAAANMVVNGTLSIPNTAAVFNMGTNTLTGTLGTITNNGTIATTNTSVAPLASDKVWGGSGTVNYAVSAGGQKIMPGTYTKLILSNTSGIDSAYGDIGLTDMLTTSGGTFELNTYRITATAATVAHSGIIRTRHTSTNAPLPSNKTWAGTVEYYAPSTNQTIAGGIYNTLSLSHNSGVIDSASGNIIVNTAMTIPAGVTMDMKANMLSGPSAAYTNNGILKTANTSGTPIPSGRTWSGTVEYYATTGNQSITDAVSYNNLTLSNTSGTNTATTNLVVNGTLSIPNANASLNLGTNTLTGTLATITNNGRIRTFNTTGAPLASGKTWGGTGTVEYAMTTGGQTVVTGSYFKILLSNTSGTQTANGDINLLTSGGVTTQAGGVFDLTTFILSGPNSGLNFVNNGTIRTASTNTFALPLDVSWGGNIEFYAATLQRVRRSSYTKLSITNPAGVGQATGTINVSDSVFVAGTFNLVGFDLVALQPTATIVNTGTINTQSTSGTPLPSGRNWGGIVNYNASPGGQTVVTGTYNNLTLGNSTGNQSINGALTVNGVLTFSGTGKLILGSNTLNINGTLSGHTSTRSLVAGGSSNLAIGGSGLLGSSLFFDQTTPGTTNRLNNLTYNRASQIITLGNALQVKGTITPTAGTLATGNQLTLVSNAAGTAGIAAGSGTYITGNVTAERYIPSVSRRWRFLASPVIGATLDDWQNEIFITGTGGAANGFDPTASNQASVYGYNEALPGEYSANGWVAATNINNPLSTGKGFRVFIRGDRSDPGVLNGTSGNQAAVTMNATGAVNTGNITMPVSYTNTGSITNDGWNFMGNPYPSAIDWNAFHDAGRTGASPNYSGTDYTHLDATVSVYDVNTNSYVSYNAMSNTGIGILSSGVIPSGAAFWVKAAAGSPSMTMKEVYKTAAAPAAMFKEASETFALRLVQDALTADEMIVKYIPEADQNFDAYDIPKLYGEINIASITPDQTHLSGNCKPFNGVSDSIRLSLGIGKTGTYSFEFKNVKQLSANLDIHLIDAFTHEAIDMNSTNSYTFNVDKTNAAASGNQRFMIVVGKLSPSTAVEEVSAPENISIYPALTTGEITISRNLLNDDNVSVMITDAAGREMTTFSNLQWNDNKIRLDLSDYKAGTYFITVIYTSQSTTLKCIKQ